MPPGQAAIVALLLACTATGAAVASARITELVLPILIVVVAAGQLVGHATLALTSVHSHGLQLSPAMLGAHAAATVVAAILIRGGERACAAAFAAIARIAVAILTPLRVHTPLWVRTPGTRRARALELLVGAADGTRGPPVLA